jgi:thymidylate synthase
MSSMTSIDQHWSEVNRGAACCQSNCKDQREIKNRAKTDRQSPITAQLRHAAILTDHRAPVHGSALVNRGHDDTGATCAREEFKKKARKFWKTKNNKGSQRRHEVYGTNRSNRKRPSMRNTAQLQVVVEQQQPRPTDRSSTTTTVKVIICNFDFFVIPYL